MCLFSTIKATYYLINTEFKNKVLLDEKSRISESANSVDVKVSHFTEESIHSVCALHWRFPHGFLFETNCPVMDSAHWAYIILLRETKHQDVIKRKTHF